MQYNKSFYQIKSNETIFEKVKKEVNSIGYYSLPFQDTTNVKKFAKDVKQSHIAVIGIGGSTLGTFAIYQFLKRTNDFTKKLHFFESTDPTDIKQRVKKLDLEDTIFLVISKSGTTIETISIFKYLSSLVTMSKNNCVIVSETDSTLTAFAKQNGMQTFEIPKNVGGRFSVFSNVGLLPLAILGVNIDELLQGAKEVHNSFFNEDKYYDILMEKARFMIENKNRFNINVVFSYSASLEGFNKWYIQLWGESLGKININGTKQALTPIGLIGPVDQHSFLQLIAQGKRDKTVTFIKVANFEDDTKIPKNTLNGFDELTYLDNLSFAKLIDEQANATIQSIKDLSDIPYDIITINKVDEFNIAKLMYSYQLLTSVVGKFVQIDTYNQPGVEAGKIILKEKLNNKV
ncbi:glucose-6-phosphate isomerase [Malaciobacter molluscorum LMG 25693]|uniref:Glucose-6-phosphate isomerase n=1 Tax=Malaciobacter molluscorum LMG 25693 TaxID=870501 RepID=A0A2G1DFF8_9BACT|nr:glucose-6-phosphate isomerase [Malaciobacter molluscorum]AXX91762.1 phosphoglucose isomerase [Malaciobacter molluscorum LMG 25693]PHO17242.1 glucose-6-phosphate isomerase [Malaciobacter molluscorum LMG 25693]